jgi:hypothetical protein
MPSQVLSQIFEERMPQLAIDRLRPVFDLRQQVRLNPNATMRELT